MRPFSYLILALLTTATLLVRSSDVSATNPTEPLSLVKFHNGSFKSAMNKASEEGKLFFVEFYADWCTPCKWMDKTTFRDKDVVEMMNDNYVALKLDIETTEGSGLKSEYSVRMLPTIIIFNSKGEMIERVEKTLSPESMKSLLSFHDAEDSRLLVTYPFNSSPQQEANDEDEELGNLYTQYLKREKFRTNYKLQIASYTDYGEAFKKVNELSETFMEPIIVLNDYIDNMTQYKVMMGEFQSMDEAEGYRLILQRDFGIKAIIR